MTAILVIILIPIICKLVVALLSGLGAIVGGVITGDVFKDTKDIFKDFIKYAKDNILKGVLLIILIGIGIYATYRIFEGQRLLMIIVLGLVIGFN